MFFLASLMAWAGEPLLDNVVTLAASEVGGTCAITKKGTVWCWGNGFYGGHVATKVPKVKDAVDLAAGTDGWCAVHKDGRASCWGVLGGRSGHHNIVQGNGSAWRYLPDVESVTDVAVGENHVCLLAKGEVQCWGSKWSNMPDLPSGFSYELRPVTLPLPAIRLEANGSKTCAQLEDGTIWCWAGHRDLQSLDLEGNVVRNFSVGGVLTCSTDQEEEPNCWRTHLTRGEESQKIDTPTGVRALSLARDRGCVAYSDKVRCFSGEGYRRGEWSDVDLNGVVGIATGSKHQCALNEEGRVWCWGDAVKGALGSGYSPTIRLNDEIVAYDVRSYDVANDGSWCAVSGSEGLVCAKDLHLEWEEWTRLNEATTVVFAGGGLCGLFPDRSIGCVSAQPKGFGLPKRMEGGFSQIDGNLFLICGVDKDDTLVCEGLLPQFFQSAAPPPLSIPDVQSFFLASDPELSFDSDPHHHQEYGCAVSQSKLLCFGPFSTGSNNPAPGANWMFENNDSHGPQPISDVKSVYGTTNHLCVKGTRSHRCSLTRPGYETLFDPISYSSPQFRDFFDFCGITERGELFCYEDELHQVEVDSVISVGTVLGEDGPVGCFLRSNRELRCWSEPWVLSGQTVSQPQAVVKGGRP
ncbi:MAG: hypothetical protein HN348_03805 [Proteobacteria bacterium]|nr:hypothetical protein [Pseudomonadota bacterium]